MGARPLGRVIQEKLKRPLAEEILFGKLEKGGVAVVDLKGGKLVFEYEDLPDDAQEPEEPESSKQSREEEA